MRFHGLSAGFFRQSSNCATTLILHSFVPTSALVESDKTQALPTYLVRCSASIQTKLCFSGEITVSSAAGDRIRRSPGCPTRDQVLTKLRAGTGPR